MKCISSAEIFNMALPMSNLVLEKLVPVLVWVRGTCVRFLDAVEDLLGE